MQGGREGGRQGGKEGSMQRYEQSWLWSKVEAVSYSGLKVNTWVLSSVSNFTLEPACDDTGSALF